MLVPKIAFTPNSKDDALTQYKTIQKLSILSQVLVSVDNFPYLNDSELKDTPSSHFCQLKLLSSCRVILGPFRATQLDIALSYLDESIPTILFDVFEDEFDLITQLDGIPFHRIVFRLRLDATALNSCDTLIQQMKMLSNKCSGFILCIHSIPEVPEENEFTDHFDPILVIIQRIRSELKISIYFGIELEIKSENASWIPFIALLHRKNIHVIAPAACEPMETPNVLNACEAFIKCARSDRPDGLLTSVVVDEAGTALGLVYSSEQSLQQSFSSGYGVYYSRSRKQLWRKGETSGNVQLLIQLDLDCDSDAVRFTVRQSGVGFCHLDQSSCWGQASGLRSLEKMLQSRVENAPTGSYTKRLLEDTELLRDKLVEEAQELAEAESKEEVAGEAADLLYFLMVKCVAAGISLTDIEKQLDKRSLKVKRRAGNSKTFCLP
uniref:Uncharacterized protein ALNC14_083790 n=1 Tax=Albugo laibachii Nc14 TaxID=890382 RepID=F0WLR4_9STRA|nr:unnamed protein product [Albugo laibachii Nc14]|eukprot:CCA22236.1 unnamed protein product [Albugo laibachii Nc14]